MITAKDIPQDIYKAAEMIIELDSTVDKLKNEIRMLQVKMMLENICPFCGNKQISEEGHTNVFFCDNCKSMMIENKYGGYEVRQARRIK